MPGGAHGQRSWVCLSFEFFQVVPVADAKRTWRAADGGQTRAIDTGALRYLGHTDVGLYLDQDGNPQVAYINWRDLRFAAWTGDRKEHQITMNWEDRRLVWVVREPFRSKLSSSGMVAGLYNPLLGLM